MGMLYPSGHSPMLSSISALLLGICGYWRINSFALSLSLSLSVSLPLCVYQGLHPVVKVAVAECCRGWDPDVQAPKAPRSRRRIGGERMGNGAPPTKGSGERRELPQRGPEQSPGPGLN